MIFLAVTKPKKKANALIKAILVSLLLSVLLSSFYHLMRAADSLERFAAKDGDQVSEPLSLDGELPGLDELDMWQGLKTVFQIK